MTSAASTNQEAVSIPETIQGAALEAQANQRPVSIHAASEAAASVALVNQEPAPASLDGVNAGAASAASATTINVVDGERHIGDGSTNQIAARVPPDGSFDLSADCSTEYHVKRVVPPEGSSERSTGECSVDTGRPRAIQGLDGREAKYLRQAASRVRKLWSKANAEKWAEEVRPSVGE